MLALPKPGRKKKRQRDGDDDHYRAAIKRLHCCSCGKHGPSDPSHLKQGTGERGGAMRSSDRWLVPQCRDCHDQIEAAGTQNETEWFAERGVDALALARELAVAWELNKHVNNLKLAMFKHGGP